MECMKRSLAWVRSFSKGKIWVSRKRGKVWEETLDLVMILIAFFRRVEILLREVWEAQLRMVGQLRRWEWNIEK
jgi:hypothetical protein